MKTLCTASIVRRGFHALAVVRVRGEERLRGRVERVLRAERSRAAAFETDVGGWLAERGSDARVARALLARLERRLYARGDELTLGELERLLRLQARVSRLEEFERLRELSWVGW
ncbi:MAG: hypothetical protein ABR583_01800 [Gaiellaceae bacterium]